MGHPYNMDPLLISVTSQMIDTSELKFKLDYVKIKEKQVMSTEEVRFSNIRASWVLYLQCLSLHTYDFQPTLELKCEQFENDQFQQYSFNLKICTDGKRVLQTPDYYVKCSPVSLNEAINRFPLLRKLNATVNATVSIHCNSIIPKICANFIQKFAENNIQLLNDSLYSDFTFIVAKKEFKVHKNILAASSPVFGKLFNCPMQESIRNKCEVDHITSHTFDQMLHFIYGGIFPNRIDENTAMKLYEAADYYGIQQLKDICQEAIRSKLTNENVVAIYSWAQLYRVKELKTNAEKAFNVDASTLSSLELINEIIERKENELLMLKHLFLKSDD